MSDNTPLPWYLDGPDMFGDYNILHHGDALAVGAVVSNMRPPEEVKANALLLVHGANKHELLQAENAALRAEVERLRDTMQQIVEEIEDGRQWRAQETARTAIQDTQGGDDGR